MRKLLIAALLLAITTGCGNADTNTENSTEGTTETTKADKGLIRGNIYQIAKQFAKGHLGDADYGMGDDGFEDMEGGEYYVTGIADLPGKRVRWTVQLQYNGGEWQYRDNWTEKGWYVQ